jgi:SAM-dependent methyltransferase
MEPQQSGSPGPFDDGGLYDVLCSGLDYGNDYYVDLARRAKGPVLDVACGTGRILLPCLRAGADAEGLDLFDGMLARLRHKAAAEGFDPPLHRADMREFRLARRFALVMIPFNAFIHNMTADAQISCLRHCREHLQPGGLLAFDVAFPDPAAVVGTDGKRVLEGEVIHQETGLPVRMYDTRAFDRVAQTQRSLMEVELLDAGGNIVETHRWDFTVRYFYATELELLLRLAGFSRWELFGGFDRRPLAKETDAIVVEARAG